MAGRCTVCRHPRLAEIDAALVEGESPYDVVAHFGSLSRPAVQRHKERHLPAKLVRAKQVRDRTEADALMARVLIYEQQARDVYEAARDISDLNAALRAITTARNTTALLVNMREKYETERRLEALEERIRKAEQGKRGMHG